MTTHGVCIVNYTTDCDNGLLTWSQHQPGQLVGNDTVPEFNAKTLPPGTAPKQNTFQPNPVDDAPPIQQELKDVDADAPQTSASET